MLLNSGQSSGLAQLDCNKNQSVTEHKGLQKDNIFRCILSLNIPLRFKVLLD